METNLIELENILMWIGP